MWGKLLAGLGVLLGIFLVIRTLLSKGRSAIVNVSNDGVNNVPRPVSDAFNSVFGNSDYKATKRNWLAVSKMETAGWTSKLFINGFNLWGMKKAKVRPNTQESSQWGYAGREMNLLPNAVTQTLKYIPGQSQWATYKNLPDAVEDIILWMQYTKFPNRPMSLREHVFEMKKRSYFVGEDLEEYLNKILAWEKR